MACINGASVKPGVSPTAEVVISRSAWEQLTGTPSSWLDGILDAFTPSIVKVADLCALNVSDPVDLTATQIAAAIAGEPIAILEAEQWAKAKLTYYEFTQLCVCNPAATPTCFSMPVITGAVTSYTTSSRCYSVGFQTDALSGLQCTGLHIEQFGTTFGGGGTDVSLWDISGALLHRESLFTPVGGTVANLMFVTPQNLLPSHQYVIGWNLAGANIWAYYAMVNVANNGYYSPLFGGVCGGGVFNCFPTDQGEPWWAQGPIVCTSGTTPPSAVTQPAQPSDLVLPPNWSCATACDVMVRLQQLSDRLDWMRRDLTLIQRQAVPFAYLLGAAHPGLTGHGAIAVAGILGASVSLTTVPAAWGSTTDVPRRLIPKAGSLAFATANGNEDERQVHYDQELVLGISGAITSIEYTFRPGIVATITPLVREP